MGRPREFDETLALEGAMNVFWEKGYEAATLPDLLGAMGLTRGSFYKAFGCKRAVYLAALASYGDTVVGKAIATLDASRPGAGRQRVKRLFRSQVAVMNTPMARRGCFLCKAAVDRAPHDRDVERLVLAITGRLELAFGRAVLNGAPRTRASARKAGAPLAAAYLAIQILRNAGASASAIGTVARGATASL
jgi:TetR/AcrR family transcriptional repressor of nem operon